MSTWQNLNEHDLGMKLRQLQPRYHSPENDLSWTDDEINLGLRMIARPEGGIYVQDYDSRVSCIRENGGEAIAALRSMIPSDSEE